LGIARGRQSQPDLSEPGDYRDQEQIAAP
jgi:hypothetical protein